MRFLAIQSISRENVPEYARYAAAVREVVARVNGMSDPDPGADLAARRLRVRARDRGPVAGRRRAGQSRRRRHEPRRQGGRDRRPRRDRAVRDGRRRRAARSGRADGRCRGRRGHERDARARPRDAGRRARARGCAGCARRSARRTSPGGWRASCATSRPSPRGGRPPSRALRDKVRTVEPALARLDLSRGGRRTPRCRRRGESARPMRTKPFFSSTRCEPTFVHHDSVQRTLLDLADEQAQRFRGDAAAPELAAEPVAHERRPSASIHDRTLPATAPSTTTVRDARRLGCARIRSSRWRDERVVVRGRRRPPSRQRPDPPDARRRSRGRPARPAAA